MGFHENVKWFLEKYWSKLLSSWNRNPPRLYPDELIFNMDESWVSTEDKQPVGHVVHTDNSPPISFLPPEGKHVTLIACISKSADEVPSAYILPKRMVSEKLVNLNHLRRVPYWFQESGFMTKFIMISWLIYIYSSRM